MQVIHLPKDIKVYCTAATTFQGGVQRAYFQLQEMLKNEGRNFYGIFFQDQFGINIYAAGVSEVYNGESEHYGFESFNIIKGKYLSELMYNWQSDFVCIQPTFQKLLTQPGIDRSSPLIEWYKNEKELYCMVKLKQ